MTENIETKLDRHVMLQNVFIWLRIGSSGGGRVSCKRGDELSSSTKCGETVN
jgi:hypothetical protein